MAANSTYRIHAVDPVRRQILTTWVLPGAVPKALFTAISALAAGSASRDQSALLRSEYGTDYKQLVGQPDPFKTVTGGDAWMERVDDALTIGGAPDDFGLSQTGLKGANIDDLVIDDDDLLAETASVKQPKVPDAKVTVEETKSSLDVVYPGGIVVTNAVKVYPEDRLSSLRGKIYLLSGIPPYRQHIFYLDSSGNRVTTYRIYSDSAVSVDIVGDLSGAGGKDIMGMTIDKTMYTSRESLRVDTIEAFNLIETTTENDFYVVDLDLFTHKSRSQLAQLSNERYQFELLYYGFILKYFPLLTFESFHEYVRNERELFQKYPDMAPSTSYLRSLTSAEASVSDRIVRNPKEPGGVGSMSTKSYISLGITHAILGPTHIPSIVDIRNLFDVLRVSIEVPEIRAYIENPPNKYLVTKTWSGVAEVPFPTTFRSGLMICVSLVKGDQTTFHRQSSGEKFDRASIRYAYISVRPNGKITIRLAFPEESSGDFAYVEKTAMGILNPWINTINGFGRQVFGTARQLTPLSHNNSTYETINLSVYWKKIFSVGMFKTLRGMFEKYVHAGIVTMKPTQTADTIDMMWRRGMYQFDPSQIERILVMASANTEILNHYMNLSNTTIHTKWLQIYDGRGFRAHHRATDIRFECINIRQREFEWLYAYLQLFITDAARDPALSRPPPAADGANTKKLRKLREADPELYNLKKHGSDRVYSIICQLPNQPLLYTAEEFEHLSQVEKKKLIRYWNFTYNRPAYYSCPHQKYPYFSFKTGIHPKGYCLPCCKKTAPDDNPTKALIHKACLERKPIDESSLESDLSDISRHTVAYGKELTVGRASKTPPSLSPLLANTLTPPLGYYLVGVEQGEENLTSMFHCMTFVLNMEPKQLVAELSEFVKTGVYFDVGLNGTIREHFRDRAQLVATIRRLPTLSILDTNFRKWGELISEIVSSKWRIHVVRFEDPDGTGARSVLKVADYTRMAAIDDTLDRVAVLVSGPSNTYPLVVLDRNYYKTFSTHTTVYTSTSPLLSYIKGAIRSIPPTVVTGVDLSDIRKFVANGGHHLATKYINLHNKCFAVLIKDSHDNHVYVPIVPSPHYADGIHNEYTGFSGKTRVKYSYLVSMLKHLRDAFPQFATLYSPHVAIAVDSHATPYGITCGTRRDIWYVTDFDTNHGLHVVSTGFDPKIVDNLIISAAPPVEDAREKLRGVALYRAYLYQLLVVEFSGWVSRLRDKSVRARILGDLGKHGGRPLRHYHKDLIARVTSTSISPKDRKDVLGVILSLHSNPLVTVAEFLEVFSHTQYEFDRTEASSLQPGDVDRLLTVLRGLVTITDRAPSMGNIFVACSSNPTGKHCIDGKLAISEHDLVRFGSVLDSDLHNPFLRQTILSGISTVGTVDFLRFESQRSTIIRVQKVVI